MSINSISAASSYYYSSGIDSEYELIKQRLKALGISPTGSKSTDKLLLEKAEKTQKSSTVKSAEQAQSASISSQNQPAAPPEWQKLMQEAGITPSGDLYTDYKNAVDAVNSKIQSANSDSEKTKYIDLLDRINRFMSNNQELVSSSSSAMVGASALSAINKALLVNK